jgi:hypothetical protein
MMEGNSRPGSPTSPAAASPSTPTIDGFHEISLGKLKPWELKCKAVTDFLKRPVYNEFALIYLHNLREINLLKLCQLISIIHHRYIDRPRLDENVVATQIKELFTAAQNPAITDLKMFDITHETSIFSQETISCLAVSDAAGILQLTQLHGVRVDVLEHLRDKQKPIIALLIMLYVSARSIAPYTIQ